LHDVRLELNSLGQASERATYRDELIGYLERHRDALDEDACRRLYTNPLRILDSKNSQLAPVLASAPRLFDFLGAASKAHFQALTDILDANGVAYTLNHRLVRGLDYYNLSVFEFVTDRLGAQGTVCAGGRYDDLIAQVGGKSAPAVGWALGVERILSLMKESGRTLDEPLPAAFAIVPDAAAFPVAMKVLQQLRELGLSIQMHAGSASGLGSMKSQFKKADNSGASYALIFGAEELARGSVAIKSLRDGVGQQSTWMLDQLPAWAATLQSQSPSPTNL